MESAMVSYNIVCLEDDIDLAKLISISLRPWPVHVAHDGIRGLALIREQKPDLILLDLGLPGLNGWEVCRAIKNDEDLKQIPIVVLTAIPPEVYCDHSEHRELFKLVSGYLLKPFSPRTLSETLRPYLPHRRATVR